MEFSIERDDVERKTLFSGSVSDHDLQKLKLDRLERMVVGSQAQAASDHLQSLEIIFRRLEQQSA